MCIHVCVTVSRVLTNSLTASMGRRGCPARTCKKVPALQLELESVDSFDGVEALQHAISVLQRHLVLVLEEDVAHFPGLEPLRTSLLDRPCRRRLAPR